MEPTYNAPGSTTVEKTEIRIHQVSLYRADQSVGSPSRPTNSGEESTFQVIHVSGIVAQEFSAYSASLPPSSYPVFISSRKDDRIRDIFDMRNEGNR